MIKVAAITSGENVPSSRFRIRQYIPLLSDSGIEVKEYVPLIDKYSRLPNIPSNVGIKCALKLACRIPDIIGCHSADITWLERGIYSGRYTLEGLLRRPLVFDVDDAIWLTPPSGRFAAKKIAERAAVVIAGNSFIANWFNQYNKKVTIIPTAIDADKFRPHKFSKPRNGCNEFIMGWTGLSTNFPYLYDIEEPLWRFMRDFQNARLFIIADRPPEFNSIPNNYIKYIKWSPRIETQALQQMHAGLMPLPDNDWTRGKCSFKMLQYMATGLPVVVSPVGMNAEILGMGDIGFGASTFHEWYDALKYLYYHPAEAFKLGLQGSEIVKRNFSCKVIAKRLSRLFRNL